MCKNIRKLCLEPPSYLSRCVRGLASLKRQLGLLASISSPCVSEHHDLSFRLGMIPTQSRVDVGLSLV